MTAQTLVLASANRDKAAEISAILAAVPGLTLVPRPEDVPDVDETGTTLVENARLKARALCAATGLAAVADDTGLEVDALDGAPGVYSARFAGEGATYADNVAKLLAELNVPLPLLTQIMMRTSDFFVHNWAGVLGGVAATWAGLHFGTRLSPGFALLVDRAKLKIPVIGGLWCMIGMARFAQNLGVMYGAGIALPEALGMVAGLTGNRVLEKSITELRQAVTEGRQMHSVMGSHPIFSKLVSQMIAVGETTPAF